MIILFYFLIKTASQNNIRNLYYRNLIFIISVVIVHTYNIIHLICYTDKNNYRSDNHLIFTLYNLQAHAHTHVSYN